MKKVLLILFLLSTTFVVNGQNLVPNGNFEQYSGCPIWNSQLDSVLFWINPAVPPTGGTPDYFNQCAYSFSGVSVPYNFPGYQLAHSGVAYCGLGIYGDASTTMNWHEYVEVPLTSSLIANSCYQFEMYINNSNVNRFTSDDIGVYFSDTVISGINNWFQLPFTPQIVNTPGVFPDTLNWTLVSGNYTAAGGESFIIIGNYKANVNTTLVVSNNSASLETVYFYIDDVSLTPTPCTGIEEYNPQTEINIYPNPATDFTIIEYTLPQGEYTGEIIFFDMQGNEIKHFTVDRMFDHLRISTYDLPAGTYIYTLQTSKGISGSRKMIKIE